MIFFPLLEKIMEWWRSIWGISQEPIKKSRVIIAIIVTVLTVAIAGSPIILLEMQAQIVSRDLSGDKWASMIMMSLGGLYMIAGIYMMRHGKKAKLREWLEGRGKWWQ